MFRSRVVTDSSARVDTTLLDFSIRFFNTTFQYDFSIRFFDTVFWYDFLIHVFDFFDQKSKVLARKMLHQLKS